MTGEYNPDLRQPYPNATYTVDGRFHYTTDAWPRTLLLEVDMLGDVAERFRCRSDSVQGHFKDYGNELASEYDSQLESYKMFEENIAANPENFRNLVVEFKYPEPAGPEFTPADKVPTKFIATWNDASGKSMRRRFENVPAGKGGQ